MAFLAAAELDIDACISFYGTALEDCLDAVPRMSCPIMLHYGGKDRFISKESVDEIAGALAGRPHTEIFTYPEANHGFYTRGNAEDMALAHERTAVFLKAAFTKA
jgi:carboxymethylenebutenolidase